MANSLAHIARYGDGNVLTAYEPTLREKVNYWLARNWYGDTREGVDKASKLSNVLETVTPYGIATMGYDAGRALGGGRPVEAGLLAAMAAAPLPASVEKSAAKGIRAYHGSPHSFDKFSLDKIGTGEGAQAYGHGLYFAENEGVAKGYRDTLTAAANSMSGVAKKVLPKLDGIKNIEVRPRPGQAVPEIRINGRVRYGDDVSFAAEKIHEQKGSVTVDDLWQYFESKPVAQGSMYEVNIKANPDDFLDWDKPLSEQGPKAKAAADKIFDPGWNDGSWTPTGESLIGKVDQKKRAEILKEAGIPGVKYLDAGSRGAGDGSRNYVVFDDKLIEIVKKYGIAGASAMLGMDVLANMDEAQAATLKKAESEGGVAQNRFAKYAPQNTQQAPQGGNRFSKYAKTAPAVNAAVRPSQGPQTVNSEGKGSRERQVSEYAADVGRSAMSGLRSGVEMLAGTAGDVQNMGGDVAGWLAAKAGLSPEAQGMAKTVGRRLAVPGLGDAPATEAIQSATTSVAGPAYQPQTTPGKFARTIGEFAPNALAGPGGVGRKAAMTVIPAVASEALGQATEGSGAEPYARAAGAIIGGGLSAGTKTATTNKVLKEASKTSKQLQAAKNEAYRVAEETVGKQPMQTREFADIVRLMNKDAIAKGVGGALSETTDKLYSSSKSIVNDLSKILTGVARGERPAPTYGELEKMRQTLNDVVQGSKDVAGKMSADGYLASQFVKRIDDAMGKTPFKDARNSYKTLRKTERIERAISDAENASSSVDLAYKREFRKILKENTRNPIYSPAEIAAIRRVAGHGSVNNLLESFGRLGMTSKSAWGPWMSGVGGFAAAGPIGAAVPIVATVARAAGTRATKARTEAARNITALGPDGLRKVGQKLRAEQIGRNARRALILERSARDPALVGE